MKGSKSLHTSVSPFSFLFPVIFCMFLLVRLLFCLSRSATVSLSTPTEQTVGSQNHDHEELQRKTYSSAHKTFRERTVALPVSDRPCARERLPRASMWQSERQSPLSLSLTHSTFSRVLRAEFTSRISLSHFLSLSLSLCSLDHKVQKKV